MFKTLTAAALGLALLAGPAAAQDPRGAALVAAQLDAVVEELGMTGGERTTGRLLQGDSQVASLRAPAGTVYVVGACDENCRDLDLIVRDSEGREVGRDQDLDDTPIVLLQTTGGTYSVEVSMPACLDQCHWGVGVFR